MRKNEDKFFFASKRKNGTVTFVLVPQFTEIIITGSFLDLFSTSTTEQNTSIQSNPNQMIESSMIDEVERMLADSKRYEEEHKKNNEDEKKREIMIDAIERKEMHEWEQQVKRDKR